MVVPMFDALMEELAAVADLAAPTSHGEAPGDELSRRELSELVAELAHVRSVLDAVSALAVHRWEESLAWTDEGARSPAAWLRHHTSVATSTARRELRIGKFLARRPEVTSELVAGRISLDHVSTLERIDLPRVRDLFDAHLDELLSHARDLSADDFAKLCRRWLSLADEDGPDPDRRRFERRKVHLNQGFRGNWRMDAELLDDVGAMLSGELTRIEKEQWEAEQRAIADDPSLAFDHTPAQRRADAFAELIRRALGVDVTSRAAARPSVSVIIDEDSLRAAADGVTEAGEWLSGSSVREAACDSVIYSITMRQGSIPINLGRTARLATPEQRRVIIARDRTCVWPGCDAPPAWCKVHHLDFWEHGGLTDVDTMCLVCDHHHALVHKGGWVMYRDAHGRIVVENRRGASPPDRRCEHRTRGERLAVGFADPPARYRGRRARERLRALADAA